jgi:hypothetical protein
MNTTLHFDPLASLKPMYYKGASATTIDAILTTSATLQIHTRKCDVLEKRERLNNSDHRAVLIELDLDSLLSINIRKSKQKDIPNLRFQKIKAAKELLKTGPEHSPLAREYKTKLNDAYRKHLQNNPDKLDISDLDSLLTTTADRVTSKFKPSRKRKKGWCPLILQLRQAASWAEKRLAVFEAFQDINGQVKFQSRVSDWLKSHLAAHWHGKLSISDAYQEGKTAWGGLPKQVKDLISRPPELNEPETLRSGPFGPTTTTPQSRWTTWIATITNERNATRHRLHATSRIITRKDLNAKSRLREERRLKGQTGFLFKELLCGNRTGRSDAMTRGTHPNVKTLKTPRELKENWTDHLNRHFGAGRKKWYISRKESTHLSFTMTPERSQTEAKCCRRPHGQPELPHRLCPPTSGIPPKENWWTMHRPSHIPGETRRCPRSTQTNHMG